MAKAVFLDKDGTLIPDIPYNVDPELISIQPDATLGLQQLVADGYQLIIVSNQSGAARGYFAEDKLAGVEQKIIELLKAYDIPLRGFYYCPHHPEGTVPELAIDCDCRKPQPGMLKKAAQELDINLAQSWMIGDILNDIEAGNRAGCKTVLINNGNETEWLEGEYRTPTISCSSIDEAAAYILSR
ncbi:HAD-IIIA family hydrolase [Mucilaginibacter limnophilus]|uniref:D,D-heptose 1,7-bisphosphate phosphatase n=1 Tax=Mucilaginibacter limnophilus TaxID=1932778 RepID=A0A3S2ULU9_9SPHI|nr:HAD family hydrolase [Mucilaginibacter limnophilus]RVT97291.1 HAD-IIIA family hydrolase [Mucilaginibacter limnophilus]